MYRQIKTTQRRKHTRDDDADWSLAVMWAAEELEQVQDAWDDEDKDLGEALAADETEYGAASTGRKTERHEPYSSEAKNARASV